MRVVIWVVLYLLTATNAQNTTGECDLDCYFGECVPGPANFSDHPKPDGQPLDIHTKVRMMEKGFHVIFVCDVVTESLAFFLFLL